MAVISFSHKGNFNNIEKFFKGYNASKILSIIEAYGQEGVRALSSATPVDTGLTAGSWSYRTELSKGSFSIIWTNSNTTTTGTPIVILLQYGFGTKNGGFVQGIDFINPAIFPTMNNIAEAVWREVCK